MTLPNNPLQELKNNNYMDYYSRRDGTNYSHAYIASPGRKGIDISNIDVGTYTVKLTLNKDGFKGSAEPYIVNALKNYRQSFTKSGYKYTVKVENNKIKVKNLRINFHVRAGTFAHTFCRVV